MSSVLVLGTLAAPVSAQDANPQDKPQAEEPAPSAAEVADDLHDRRVDYQGNIIVSAGGLAQLDLLAGPSVFEAADIQNNLRSEEHTSELQSLMRISFAVFGL